MVLRVAIIIITSMLLGSFLLAEDDSITASFNSARDPWIKEKVTVPGVFERIHSVSDYERAMKETLTDTSTDVVIVKLSAGYCVPCRGLLARFRQLLDRRLRRTNRVFERVVLIDVDIDKVKEHAQQQKAEPPKWIEVGPIPTCFFYRKTLHGRMQLVTERVKTVVTNERGQREEKWVTQPVKLVGVQADSVYEQKIDQARNTLEEAP